MSKPLPSAPCDKMNGVTEAKPGRDICLNYPNPRIDVCGRAERTGAALGHVTGSSREAFSNTQACERAIERDEKDMSRGWSHGTGTKGRGLHKPISSVHACVSSKMLENGLHSRYRPCTYLSKKHPIYKTKLYTQVYVPEKELRLGL